MKIFLHRFGRGILFAGLALSATLGMNAEKGVILIDSDGNQRQMTLAEVKRVDIGTSGLTLHHVDGSSSAHEYANIDRLLIGAETTSVKNLMSDGEIAVWPTRTSSSVNVTGAKPATAVSVHSLNGALVCTAQADSEGSATVDLSSSNTGVYIITVGSHSVKIVKE